MLVTAPADIREPLAGLTTGAVLNATGGRARAALPPGRRVVALGEVDGVSRSSRRPAARRGHFCSRAEPVQMWITCAVGGVHVGDDWSGLPVA